VTTGFDVLVVGAGPAGCVTAEEAARRGARVCLIEQSEEIGYPIRTSGGSFISELRELGISERFFHAIRRVKFASRNRSIAFDYPEPVVCVLDVRALYQHLALMAASAGVELRLGSRVIDVVREGTRVCGVIVRTGGATHNYAAPVVVDCSGFAAVVLRKAGLRDSFRRFGFGAEYDLYAPRYPEDEALLVVGSDVIPCGYGWAFPRGGGRVRVGVGTIHPDTRAVPQRYLDRFMHECAAIAPSLIGAQPLERHVGYIPSEGVCREFVFDGVMAVGDAAGQASTLLGEGIRYSIKAGRMAGRVVGEAVVSGDPSRARLSQYQARWLAEHGRFMRLAYIINRRIARYDDAKWDRGIALLEKLSPQVFSRLLMSDFSPGVLARVVAAAPRVLASVFRSFVAN